MSDRQGGPIALWKRAGVQLQAIPLATQAPPVPPSIMMRMQQLSDAVQQLSPQHVVFLAHAQPPSSWTAPSEPPSVDPPLLLASLPPELPLLASLPPEPPLLASLPPELPLLASLPPEPPLLASLPPELPLLASLPPELPLLASLPLELPLADPLPLAEPLPPELPLLPRCPPLPLPLLAPEPPLLVALAPESELPSSSEASGPEMVNDVPPQLAGTPATNNAIRASLELEDTTRIIPRS